MQRDNQAWLTHLRSAGEQRDEALNDLRAILLRIFPNALSRWLPPASERFDAFIDDVTQEALLRVLDRLGTFEGRSQFTTWVYKIAIHIALSELRLRKWKEISLDGLEEGGESGQMPSKMVASSDPGPELILERRDALSMVRQIMEEELTPRQRAVMMAINVQGVPMDVIAQRLGSNRNAVYKLMHDARLKLKRRLEREGLSPAQLLAMFGN